MTSLLWLMLFGRIPISCSDCVQVEEYYAHLLPEGSMTAQEGDIVSFMCSTNLPATFARWEINDEKYPINLPSLFTTSGLNLSFSFVTDTKIRCFFSIYFRESAVDICSNNVTIKALETVSFQSCGIVNRGLLNTTLIRNTLQISTPKCLKTPTGTDIPSLMTLIKSHPDSSVMMSSFKVFSSRVTSENICIQGCSSPLHNAVAVLTAVAAIVIFTLVFVIAVAVLIFCRHKSKGAKFRKECHVYDEVDIDLSANPVVRFNQEYPEMMTMDIKANPAYVSTHIR